MRESKKAHLLDVKSDLLLAQTMVVPKVAHLAEMKASMSEIQRVSNSVDKTDARKGCSKDKALADQTVPNWAHSSEKTLASRSVDYLVETMEKQLAVSSVSVMESWMGKRWDIRLESSKAARSASRSVDWME